MRPAWLCRRGTCFASAGPCRYDTGIIGAHAASIAGVQVIDLSLHEPMFSVQAPEAAIHWVTGKVKERIEYRISTQCLLMPRLQIRRPLRLDEFVAMRIFDVIGRPEMKLDARFPAQRNDAPAVMQQSGATVGRVYDICDIVEDRHFKERGIMVEVEDADKGSLPMHNIVPRVSVTPGCCRRPAPLLGEHTGEILSEIGFAWEHLGEKPRMTEGVE